MDKKSLHIIVSGIVQGVGFRYYTKLEADKYHIFGTVMNKEDGTVEIYAQGEFNKLMQFLEWCHDGPTSARVEELSYKYIEPNSYLGFVIER